MNVRIHVNGIFCETAYRSPINKRTNDGFYGGALYLWRKIVPILGSYRSLWELSLSLSLSPCLSISLSLSLSPSFSPPLSRDVARLELRIDGFPEAARTKPA